MHQPDKHQGNSKKSAACFYTLLSPSNGDYNRGNKDYNGDNHKPQKYWIRSISLYLQEIKNIPLLTPDEEKELAKKIKLGNNNALNKLVASNLRIVITIAKQHKGRGLSLEDLIQEGNLGLIQAAKRFDETQGYKFITYAVWWIRQSILYALAENSGAVRLPLKKLSPLFKIGKAYKKLSDEKSREPTASELAEELEIAPEDTEDVLRVYLAPFSLDSPVPGYEQYTHLVLLEDENSGVEDRLLQAS